MSAQVHRTLVLSSLAIAAVTVFLKPAFGAMVGGSCDSVMQGLAKQFDACPGGNCAFKVSGGQLQAADNMSSPLKVERGEDYTTIRDISKASGESLGVSAIRIKNAAGGAMAFQVTQRDKSGGELVNEFILNPASAQSCSLMESSRKVANETMAKVDFEDSFCDAANDAFKGVSADMEKACADMGAKLVEAYEKSADELTGKRKIFREASLAERAASTVGMKSPTSMFKQALAQREHCGKSQMAVTMAALMENPDKFKTGNFAALTVSKAASQPIGEMFAWGRDWGLENAPMSRPLNAVPQSSKAAPTKR